MKPSNAYSAKDLQNLKDQSFEGKKLLNNLVDNGPRNKQNLLGLNMNFQEQTKTFDKSRSNVRNSVLV